MLFSVEYCMRINLYPNLAFGLLVQQSIRVLVFMSSASKLSEIIFSKLNFFINKSIYYTLLV